jgi:hypothetical protein
MKKNTGLILILIAISLLLTRCVKDHNNGPCEIVSDFFFSGMIFEDQICLNDGRDGVGINCSYVLKDNSTEIGMYRFGLDTYPVFRFDTWITLVTPYINVLNYDHVWELFEPGIKLFTDPESVNDKRFDFEYTVVNSVMGSAPILMSYYYTISGDQAGSSINIIERKETVSSDPDYREIAVKMVINCKLYSYNKILQGELIDAEANLLLKIPV